jgi:hypothetical protein
VQYRILILENEFGLGGSEKKLFEFISRADRSRVHIAVCCLKQGGYFKPKLEAIGVPFYDGLLSHRFDAPAFRDLESVLRRERTQLIYTFTHPNTVIFAYLARMRGLVDRFVVSYHATGNPQGGRLVPLYLRPLAGGRTRAVRDGKTTVEPRDCRGSDSRDPQWRRCGRPSSRAGRRTARAQAGYFRRTPSCSDSCSLGRQAIDPCARRSVLTPRLAHSAGRRRA